MGKQLKGLRPVQKTLTKAPWIPAEVAKRNRIFRRVCQLVRAFREKHPPWDMRCGWVLPPLDRVRAIPLFRLAHRLSEPEPDDSGERPDTTEWPDAPG